MTVKARSVAHLTKNQLKRSGGVSQNQISGTTRYNQSNQGAVGSGVISGGAGNPNIKVSTALAGAVPNTTRRRYVVS